MTKPKSSPKINPHKIKTAKDLAKGAAALAKIEPAFAKILPDISPLPLRLRGDGFAALLDTICSQQLSVAAANTIWARLETADLISEPRILAADETTLRACGLSGQKVRYAKALAEAALDYPALHNLPVEEVLARLQAVLGIGKWSAEIYAMFSLGCADILPAGDLALQESARVLFGLKERPTEKALEKMAQKWHPWRSIAARILWAQYRIQKQREGIR